MAKPYYDLTVSENEWIRTFESPKPEDLVWHRDEQNRRVRVIEGHGWKFQYDNQIPVDIMPDSEFVVESMVYHRLIKGDDKLVLWITEET